MKEKDLKNNNNKQEKGKTVAERFGKSVIYGVVQRHKS